MYKCGCLSYMMLFVILDVGLKNLYKFVLYFYFNYFYCVLCVLRLLLKKYCEGILVGMVCDKGEVFEVMM